MGIVFKNNAKTTLGSSLTNSATSATVTDGSVFPSLAAGEFFFCTFDDGTNNEIVKVTARSSNTLTIVRAQESTTARAFSSGDAAELRLTAGVLETIQENIAAKSANQTVFNATTSGGATSYDIGIDPGVEANAMVFLDGVMQHHDTFSFSSSTLTFDAAPVNGTKLEVIVDNLINLQSSNLTVDSFTAADVSGSPQTDFTLSDTPAAETNLIVFVDGVFQDQDAYTISNNTLTITTGVIAGRGVTVYVINPVNIGTPSDSTVTSAKLSGNITMPGTLTVGSNDVAFDSPTFVVDNSNSRVGLGTASPSVPVDIVGDVKMSANLTVDTSTLIVDSSNNRVGIGTTSPSKKFVVSEGGAHGFEISPYDGSQNATRLINYNRNTSAYFPLEIEASQIAFEIGGTEKMRLDTSGRVGIGTTSPGRKVVIAHDVGTSLSLANSGSSVYLQIAANGHDNDNSNYIGADSSKNFTFWVSNTERMRIDNSGRVGIGTTAPTGQRLTIGGHSTNDSMTEANAWFVAEATGGDGIAMGSIASAPYSTWIQSGFLNSLGTSNHYPLSLNPHGGKVGIGTTSPQSGLHIAEGGSGSDGGSVLTLSQTGFGSIVNNDDLGSVHFGGVTGGGVGIHNAAKIMVEGDGTWASNDYPTRITFHTTTDGAASSTERMRIHNDGTVTVATIPSFAANLSSAQTVTTTDTVIAFNSETYDVGGNHSNGVFTAPVAGLYAFGAHFLIYPWTAGYLNIKWFRNTDVYHTLVQYGYSGGSHTGLSPSALIQMSANDTVSLKISGGGLNSGVTVYANQAYWWGYLVG